MLFMGHYISAFATAALISACAVAPPGKHFDKKGQLVENMSTVQTDQFSPVITVNGLSMFDNPFGGISKQWFIRSFIDKRSHNVTHQLYVSLSYLGAWKFFNSAATDKAEALKVTTIDRKVNDCTGICDFDEVIGIEIPDSTLRARAAKGLEIKISAHSGDSIVLPITSEMITKQLEIVDKAKTTYPMQNEPPN